MLVQIWIWHISTEFQFPTWKHIWSHKMKSTVYAIYARYAIHAGPTAQMEFQSSGTHSTNRQYNKKILLSFFFKLAEKVSV